MSKLSVKLNTLFMGLLLLPFLANCSKTSSDSNPVPSTPSTPVTPVTPVNPVDPGNNGIPSQYTTGAVDLSLFDNILYSGLADLSGGNVDLPVVGDPKVVLQVTNTRNTSIDGQILISFEDTLGWWGADLTSVPGTGYNGSNSFDMIFSDSKISLRVLGNRPSAGDTMNSTLYYRLRQSGETQCEPVFCYITQNGQQVQVPFNSVQCPLSPPDIVSPCRTYMTPGTTANPNPSVKDLGTFTVQYSKIAILNGD